MRQRLSTTTELANVVPGQRRLPVAISRESERQLNSLNQGIQSRRAESDSDVRWTPARSRQRELDASSTSLRDPAAPRVKGVGPRRLCAFVVSALVLAAYPAIEPTPIPRATARLVNRRTCTRRRR
jgi:hypothetical protein